jgi:hypothetical protein
VNRIASLTTGLLTASMCAGIVGAVAAAQGVFSQPSTESPLPASEAEAGDSIQSHAAEVSSPAEVALATPEQQIVYVELPAQVIRQQVRVVETVVADPAPAEESTALASDVEGPPAESPTPAQPSVTPAATETTTPSLDSPGLPDVAVAAQPPPSVGTPPGTASPAVEDRGGGLPYSGGSDDPADDDDDGTEREDEPEHEDEEDSRGESGQDREYEDGDESEGR